MQTKIENPHYRIRERLTGIALTSEEISSREARRQRAAQLCPESFADEHSAAEQLDRLASAHAPEATAEEKEWVEARAKLAEQQAVTLAAEERARQHTSTLRRLRSAAENLTADVAFEENRVVEFEAIADTRKAEFFTHGVGGRDVHFNPCGHHNAIVMLRGTAAFIRDEILPELRRRLAIAQSELDAFTREPISENPNPKTP